MYKCCGGLGLCPGCKRETICSVECVCGELNFKTDECASTMTFNVALANSDKAELIDGQYRLKWRVNEQYEDEYVFQRVSGRGNYGEVLKTDKGGVAYAVKLMRYSPGYLTANQTDIDKEVLISATLSNRRTQCHRYIACYVEHFIVPVPHRDPFKAIVYEWIEGITLLKYMLSDVFMKPKLPKYFRQAARALRFMHSKDVIWNDIHPENIMIRANRKKIALLDFGSACFTPCTELEPVKAAYASPERINQQLPSKAGDVFSLGVTFGSALLGAEPKWVKQVGGKTTFNEARFDYDFVAQLQLMEKQHPWAAVVVDMTMVEKDERIRVSEAIKRLGK